MTHRLQNHFLSFREWFAAGLLFLILPAPILVAQKFLWPTDASRVMTSSFGEYRPGHVHAGIDIKTWNRTGYKVFAIESGSVVRVRVSPYGYGRVVYLLLDNGMKVIYAHLSRFSDPIERIIRDEQKRQGRFAVEKVFRPGFFVVEKGELIGYTGRSGTGDPHLHIEVRDTENQPFNPLLLGYQIEDTVLPTLQAVAASPLGFGSHVDGDFQPKVFSLRRERKGKFILDDVIKVWGRVGLSLSAFDRADGASNKFAVNRIRLFVDEELVFTVRYDRFSLDKTRQVDLDRDYRLKRWGWGLFQKLYRDVGNDLPFYEPASRDAGILWCGDEKKWLAGPGGLLTEDSDGVAGSVFVEEGEHPFRIEAEDYFGNLSEVRGILRIVELSEIWTEAVSERFQQGGNSSFDGGAFHVKVDKKFFEETLRFCVRSDRSLPEIPSLFVKMNSEEPTFVSLIPKSAREFVGVAPWGNGVDGTMITEVRCVLQSGLEQVIRDEMRVFGITPERGGTVVSSDGLCRVIFPRGAVYRSVLGSCKRETSRDVAGTLSWQYTVSPQDVPLERRVLVLMDASVYSGEKQKLGIYRVEKDGGVEFVGNRWENGMISAWTGRLSGFAVLRDTVPPEIFYVHPGYGVHIRDRTPRITVGFRDALSGVYGEENYLVRLDGVRLIVEYDPENDIGFHQVEEPLRFGRHVLEVRIRDRSGNVIEKRSYFYIDPK